MAPATELIMATLPPARAGVGSAVNDTVRELGGALGVAIIGSIAATRYTSAMRADLAGVPALPDPMRSRRRPTTSAPPSPPAEDLAANAAQVEALARHAFIDSMTGALWVAVGAAVAGHGHRDRRPAPTDLRRRRRPPRWRRQQGEPRRKHAHSLTHRASTATGAATDTVASSSHG